MDFFHLVQKLLIEDHFDLELELEIPAALKEMSELDRAALQRNLKPYKTIFIFDNSASMKNIWGPNFWDTVASILWVAHNFDFYLTESHSHPYLPWPPTPWESISKRLAEDKRKLQEIHFSRKEVDFSGQLQELVDSAIKSGQLTNFIIFTAGCGYNENVETVVNRTASTLSKKLFQTAQIGFQFAQLGEDPGTAEYLSHLDDGLEADTQMDIVDSTLIPKNPCDLASIIIKVLLGGVVRRVDTGGAFNLHRYPYFHRRRYSRSSSVSSNDTDSSLGGEHSNRNGHV